MPTALKVIIAGLLGLLCLAQAPTLAALSHAQLHMPWKQAGLTEREAAAHLLSRFTFGPRPGQVDEAVAMGLERWFAEQLAARIPDPALDARLRDFPAIALSEAEIAREYPPENAVVNEAKRDGVVSQQLIEEAKAEKAGGAPAQGDAGDDTPAKRRLRERIEAFSRQHGYHPEKELMTQLYAQKVLRASEGLNQLSEVLTDFWFNHFNVSQTNNRTRQYLLSYERDAIRAHALGTTRDLLEATARHPAMLVYLNNAESTANPNAPTLLADEAAMNPRAGGPFGRALRQQPTPPPKKDRGLNENYARELMELHTLGVDGGYTQTDVIEVARAFTGWTVLPPGAVGREGVERRIARAERYGAVGFRVEGDFLFRPDMHDSGAKTVLGGQLRPNRGMEDGEQVLDLLAMHPATARHIATQLAVRFVADKPPQALVDRLTSVYLQHGGDTRQLLSAIVESPEFWSRDAIGAKIKSPFELAISAVRSAGGHVDEPRPLLGWISRMGEPLYAYQAPTGYPDRAEAWVNTGSLLNRMNFGLQFATRRVRGIDLNLPALHDGPEPESSEAALRIYAEILLPGRNLGPALKLLAPMVSDPALPERIAQAAPRPNAEDVAAANASAPPRRRPAEPTEIQQVVGLILGSPEFQRR
jgi:uncharacterized protein (DUF1800 family)